MTIYGDPQLSQLQLPDGVDLIYARALGDPAPAASAVRLHLASECAARQLVNLHDPISTWDEWTYVDPAQRGELLRALLSCVDVAAIDDAAALVSEAWSSAQLTHVSARGRLTGALSGTLDVNSATCTMQRSVQRLGVRFVAAELAAERRSAERHSEDGGAGYVVLRVTQRGELRRNVERSRDTTFIHLSSVSLWGDVDFAAMPQPAGTKLAYVRLVQDARCVRRAMQLTLMRLAPNYNPWAEVGWTRLDDADAIIPQLVAAARVGAEMVRSVDAQPSEWSVRRLLLANTRMRTPAHQRCHGVAGRPAQQMAIFEAELRWLAACYLDETDANDEERAEIIDARADWLFVHNLVLASTPHTVAPTGAVPSMQLQFVLSQP